MRQGERGREKENDRPSMAIEISRRKATKWGQLAKNTESKLERMKEPRARFENDKYQSGPKQLLERYDQTTLPIHGGAEQQSIAGKSNANVQRKG